MEGVFFVPGPRIGYRRVNSSEQNPERQLEGLTLTRAFTDYASGKDPQRPQWQTLANMSGKAIPSGSIPRLARSLEDLRPIVRTFTDQGIMIEFVKEHLTFTGDDAPMAVLLLSMMGAVAHSSGHPTVCSQHLRLDGVTPVDRNFYLAVLALWGASETEWSFQVQPARESKTS